VVQFAFVCHRPVKPMALDMRIDRMPRAARITAVGSPLFHENRWVSSTESPGGEILDSPIVAVRNPHSLLKIWEKVKFTRC